MPHQHVNAHIAILGIVCLALLGFMFHHDADADTGWIPPAAAALPTPRIDNGLAPPAATAPPAPQRDIDSASSLTVVVNKDRPLLEPGYTPADLVDVGRARLRAEPAAAYRQMAADAAAAGVALELVSGFRSNEAQGALFASYVQRFGPEAAERISARAGQSEHQTGLAVDISDPGGSCALQSCFADTPAGAWAAENAHRYGFILRYPADGEPVTGYAYEPWHFRFVGTGTAGEIHESGLTLEEFTGLLPGQQR